ncbi:MAG TPA: efflux transporter periplasmic adaptor subunit [Spongiibacteraceae bacterium]|nr:efflux transporter periplasmic adaptor subunit [Spongiibacteraceae bacterium]HCS27589.1 efflux transporter periplasmic adaptor subunit [Spongiibacteraceae bacterium]
MRFIVSILVLGLAGALAYQYFSSEETSRGAAKPAVTVSSYVAEKRSFSDRVEALGTLRGNESVTLSANASDTISTIHFSEGQRVKAGQLLVTLQMKEEQAQLAGARAELADQQREVKRLEGLVKTMAAAQTELDQRRTALLKAKHRIEELEARIADRRVIAPFAGVLGLRLVSPGALLNPGTPITTLDDIDTLKLDFSVPAALLGSLKAGLTLRARTAAYDRDFNGKITVVDSRVNAVDRSIRARAEFDNSEGLLKPGMLMTIELLRNPRRALLVPEAALLTRDQQHSVWIIAEDNTLQRRIIEIGSRQPGWVEVLSGLNEGENLVRANFPRLREGISVAAPNPSAPNVAAPATTTNSNGAQ